MNTHLTYNGESVVIYATCDSDGMFIDLVCLNIEDILKEVNCGDPDKLSYCEYLDEENNQCSFYFLDKMGDLYNR